MLICTDDGQFGFILTRAGDAGMFRFQLIVGGRLIGNADPCVPDSGLRELAQLKPLEDMSLRSDALILAESLNRWLIRGFVYESDAHIVAQNDDVVLASTIDIGEYECLLDAVFAARRSGGL